MKFIKFSYDWPLKKFLLPGKMELEKKNPVNFRKIFILEGGIVKINK